jgi:hypothetical protein
MLEAGGRGDGSVITLVNMIPRALSGETNQDSEANLAVNPERQAQLVGTAFTPAASGNLAPCTCPWTAADLDPGEHRPR